MTTGWIYIIKTVKGKDSSHSFSHHRPPRRINQKTADVTARSSSVSIPNPTSLSRSQLPGVWVEMPKCTDSR
ncbi:hypothetical protein D3C73_1557530 [compost metagenome]